MVLSKGKKAKVSAPEEEEGLEHIDGELVLSIERLQEIQDELEKVNEEASDKVLEVEQKYNEIRRPVYNKRKEIIQTIPDFWLTAFQSHPALGELLTEEDEKVFKYLQSLDVQDFKDVKSGYSIAFNFSTNPYFENTKLTKTISFSDEGTSKITGTTIKWKDGMEMPNGVDHKKKGGKRAFTEESFFSWFSDNRQNGGLSESEDESIVCDEVAEIIKEDLWPNPLKYFNNDADEEEMDEEEEDEEEDDDALGKNENGSDDDDSDDDEQDGDDEDEA
ncbi:hypothetical protein AMTRI_Chr04g252890 [Amborella trichopoda]|uniref:Uncharacterized protein n=1 Tax=Amborella trichopoda TaxID=13333 RepID=W1NG31_AMBTC|nr:NAP1-related protein 2 [Amborella trichopoda]ERM94443.1 hypothetical protein AMTR_s00010p00259040 [Amborella trichopoda]|eukprot:XP_006827206.1 NAP1-related protein 2 [Amborella trichopoda]